MKDRVIIGGATGYVGRALAQQLSTRYDVVGITRSSKQSDGVAMTWRTADLFSLVETKRALEGARFAVYLVHSMLPSARLTQASFEDLDVLLADNFARAASAAKAEQIVYLGGIIPKTKTLSRHLRSRLEVESVLGAHGVPVTTLRAGLVVGPNASSLPILTTLVQRLPVMLTPRWTRTPTQPIALTDVVELIEQVLGDRTTYGQYFDVGGDEVLTHLEMMRTAARELGLSRRMLGVPLLSPRLSKAWVTMVTGAPAALVGPLVESLVHAMVVDPAKRLCLARRPPTPFVEALRDAVATSSPTTTVPATTALASTVPATRPSQAAKARSSVRSVQRLTLPPGRNATWVADQYRAWLPRFLRPFLRVLRGDDATLYIHGFGLRTPLLVLDYNDELSSPDRALYYITGGLLAHQGEVTRLRGRLEFRVVPGGKEVMAAIHDFQPSLPWYVYSVTQAIAHLVVMKAFGRHLSRLAMGERS